MSIKFSIKGAVLIATIDNPPVNALGAAVRQGLAAAIDQLEGEPELKGAVIAGSPKTFSGGADIKEFGQPPVEPLLPDLLMRIEQCKKPIVAAIEGTALGGGLETALACRGRVATPGATLGLPEVNLGLIPGAGGTQRLPRIVGVKAAAEMITSGKPITGAQAAKIGLVDNAMDDVIAAALQQVDELASGPALPEVGGGSSTDGVDPEWLATFEKKLARRARGQLSPAKALEAVLASQELSLEDGLKREREIFLECMASDQRAALIHSFFVERAAKKTEFLQGVEPREVNVIGVLGAGTMGAGIAIAAAQSGYQVKLFDANDEALAAGVERIKKTLTREAEKGRVSQVAAESGDRERRRRFVHCRSRRRGPPD